MAAQGHYKQLTSTDKKLEIKLAGRDHVCAGVCIERGNRPGPLKDVWMVGRSRRCVEKIKKGSFYAANRYLPPHFLADAGGWEQWVPTCMFCVIEHYGESIHGPAKPDYLRPVTPEIRRQIKHDLEKILDDMELVG